MKQKAHIKQSFNQAEKNYDSHSQLQQHIGNTLISFIKKKNTYFKHIIDIGCGTGIVTENLARSIHYQQLDALDHADFLLAKAKIRLSKFNISCFHADFDNLQIASSSERYDLIFSNMALHWSSDFSGTLNTISQLLQKNGLLAFSIPLAGTLAELKPHCAINHFETLEHIISQLTFSGLDQITTYQENIILKFNNTKAALQSIKNIGANYVMNRSHRGLRGKIHFSRLDLTQLTYNIGHFIARA